jgi:hypothetical protein
MKSKVWRNINLLRQINNILVIEARYEIGLYTSYPILKKNGEHDQNVTNFEFPRINKNS